MDGFEPTATKLLSEMEEYLRNGGRESDVVMSMMAGRFRREHGLTDQEALDVISRLRSDPSLPTTPIDELIAALDMEISYLSSDIDD